MEKHKKNYIKSRGYSVGDWIPCAVCKKTAVDIHHINFRSQVFRKERDEPTNLVALCRECHNKAHSGELTRDYLTSLVFREPRLQNYLENDL